METLFIYLIFIEVQQPPKISMDCLETYRDSRNKSALVSTTSYVLSGWEACPGVPSPRQEVHYLHQLNQNLCFSIPNTTLPNSISYKEKMDNLSKLNQNQLSKFSLQRQSTKIHVHDTYRGKTDWKVFENRTEFCPPPGNPSAPRTIPAAKGSTI